MASSSAVQDDGDLGPQVIAVISIFTSLATLAVAGRFYARALKGLAFGIDDWMTLVALLLNWGAFIVTILSIQNGLGRHLDYLLATQAPPVILDKMLYAAQIIYVLAPVAVKLSLLLLYKRIFVTTMHRKFTIVLYGMGSFVLIYGTVFLFLSIFICTPISSFWTIQEGWCFDEWGYTLSYSVVNIITDFTIWALPIPLVWSLYLPKGQKIGLSLVFLLGLLATAAAIARIVIVYELSIGETSQSDDVTWKNAFAFEFSVVDLSTGVICACLPTMRVVFSSISPRFKRMLSPSTSRKTQMIRAERTWQSSAYNKIGANSELARLDASGRYGGPMAAGHERDEHRMQKGISVRHDILVERDGL